MPRNVPSARGALPRARSSLAGFRFLV
jgi:hypothetical protein